MNSENTSDNNEEQTLNKTDVICCNSFLKIAKHIGWFSLGGHVSERILCMPYILGTEPMVRVNYCPSCGRKIRDIKLNPDLL